MSIISGNIRLFFMVGLLILNLKAPGLACETESAGSLSSKVLPKGALSAGFSFEYYKYDELGHQNAHMLHEEGEHVHNFDHDEVYSLALGYGLWNDFELDLKLPYIQKTFLRVEDGVVGKGDSSKGIGDMTLSGKYCFYHGYTDLSWITGVKFPTGDTGRMGFDDKKLEIEELPGSGSFDYILGLAAGKEIDRLSLEGGILYTLKTQGSMDYEFGDVLELGFSSFYALRPIGQFPNYWLGAEIKSRFIKKDKDKGSKVVSSGGEVLFLSPGLQMDINKQLSAFISVPVPVSQNRGGEHSELDYSVLAGITLLWN